MDFILIHFYLDVHLRSEMISFKNISILLKGSLLVFLYGIFASEDDAILAKFHQTDYKIKIYRTEVVYLDKNYSHEFEIKTFKFNRTVTAFNITVCVKVNAHDKIDGIFQLYKRYSNEYRIFPLRMRSNFCKIFNRNIFGLFSAMKCGNVTGCVLQKDVVYRVCNYVVDESKFPPYVPTGEFKSVINVLYLEKEIATIHGYAEVYRPIKIPT